MIYNIVICTFTVCYYLLGMLEKDNTYMPIHIIMYITIYPYILRKMHICVSIHLYTPYALVCFF